jgi:hypothetical protein
MRTYSEASSDFIHSFLKDKFLRPAMADDRLEGVAQRCADLLYSEFVSSVLVRIYVTCKVADLPQTNRSFVRNVALSANVLDLLKDDSIVLTLVGTRGREPDWNDRRKSRGHTGIPLLSPKFVDTIPMISRLLIEFGIGVDWIGTEGATDIIAKRIGTMASVFFVPDATTYRDRAGRLVIPAQDFVKTYGVKSVFGLGGAYLTGEICTILVFTNERVERKTAESFSSLINFFKASTVRLVTAGAIFTSS